MYPLLASTCALILFGVEFSHFHQEIYSVLFAVLILNFAANDRIKVSLENRVFRYLGKISYGIYMLHPIAITLAVKATLAAGIRSDPVLYPMSLGTTVILASASYRFLEAPFLRLKYRFTAPDSGKGPADYRTASKVTADSIPAAK